ncbi:hypothetical protein KDN24_06095 [Bacillus sp. Bva_UNVM-123]|uniref:hypothetical protein n=1 Tax=Bacillus sp. Bva_UNVM-123 TaxID=2829798 RepID=UPI00391F8CC4
MVKLVVHLNNGKEFIANVETYNKEKINEDINNQQLTSVIIGDDIFNRHSVIAVTQYKESV